MNKSSSKKQNKQEQKTEFEIWRNIIPKNNNLKETYTLQTSEIQDKTQINQQMQTSKDRLGKGQYGEVYKVQNQVINEQFACKIFKRSELTKTVCLNNAYIKIEEFIQKELVAAKLLKNENLIIAHELIDDVNADNIYLIMELCDSEFCKFEDRLMKFDNRYFISDWFSNIILTKKQIDFKKLKKVYRQLVEGILQLHNLNLAHCDLKPQNIMLQNGNAKIADFGSLAWTDPTDNQKSTNDNGFGTPYFQAPESLISKDKSTLDKFKLDIWSLGMTFFTFAQGFLPFKIEFINGAVVPTSSDIQWSIIDSNQQDNDELRDFIRFILNPDPVKRPTIFELIKHEYLIEEEETYVLCNNYQFNNQNSNAKKDISNIFFYLQGLNSENMVDESDDQLDTDCININQLNQHAPLHVSKKLSQMSNERKQSDKKYSYKKKSYNQNKSKSILVESGTLLNPIGDSLSKQDTSNYDSQIQSNKSQISEENYYSVASQNNKVKSYKSEDQKDSKKDQNSIQDEKSTLESKNSEFIKFQSKKESNYLINDAYTSLNECESFNVNMFQTQPNEQNTQKDDCLVQNQSLELDQLKSFKNRRSSVSYNNFYQKSILLLENESDQHDLFNMIQESIQHKQRKDPANCEFDQYFRRQSDSNLLDVLELRNDFINKDHIIQECLKEIDLLEKQSEM